MEHSPGRPFDTPAGGYGPLPPLAVVVVTYNSAAVLPGLLDSLAAGLEGIERPHIVVVDNASHDACVETALLHPARPQVVQTGRNAGYAGGINAAALAIAPDADLLVLNPDIRLLPGAARRLQEHLARPGVGIAVPQMLRPDGSIARSVRREPSLATGWSEALLGGRLSTRLGLGEIVGDAGVYRRTGRVMWATGAALMVAAAARRRIGPWDESFFLYSEEVDYMRRARECGFAVDYLPEAQVVHIGGDYMSSPFLCALMTANRIRDYGRRHNAAQTALFRLGVVAGAAIRAPLGPAHRASLKAALTAPGR